MLALLAGLGCSSSNPLPDGGTDGGNELTVNLPIPGSGTTHPDCSWSQLGQNAAHTGAA